MAGQWLADLLLGVIDIGSILCIYNMNAIEEAKTLTIPFMKGIYTVMFAYYEPSRVTMICSLYPKGLDDN